MPKWDAVGFGADNADVEPEAGFSTYDEANLGVPPKGIYRFALRRLEATETKADQTPMLKMVCEISEPKGSKKAKYNGYPIWFYRTVSKEQASRVNAFLLAILDSLPEAKKKAAIKAFWTPGKVILDEDGFLTKIGTWNVPETIEVAANTRPDNYEGDKRLAITNLIPISDAPAPVPADEEDEEPEDDEVEYVDDTEEGEESEEEAELRDELEGLTAAKLRARAKKNGATAADVKGLDEEALTDLIVTQEIVPEDEEEPEEDEEELEDEEEEESEEDEDDREAELAEMSRTDLKKILKELDPSFKVTTKVTDADLIAAILELESDEDEEEEEPEDEPEEDEDEEDEPEPAKPARRAPSGRGKAAPAARTRPAARRRGGKKGADDEPPF